MLKKLAIFTLAIFCVTGSCFANDKPSYEKAAFVADSDAPLFSDLAPSLFTIVSDYQFGEILRITTEGEIILRGKTIAKDAELSKILKGEPK